MKETLKTQTKVLEALPLEVLPERFVTMHPKILTRRSLTSEINFSQLKREMSPEINVEGTIFHRLIRFLLDLPYIDRQIQVKCSH